MFYMFYKSIFYDEFSVVRMSGVLLLFNSSQELLYGRIMDPAPVIIHISPINFSCVEKSMRNKFYHCGASVI